MKEPLDPSTAHRLARSILKDGIVSYSTHAQEEMAKDDLSALDCVNVIRGGVVEPGEFSGRSWRYRIRTNRIVVIIAFRAKSELRVVTAWRM